MPDPEIIFDKKRQTVQWGYSSRRFENRRQFTILHELYRCAPSTVATSELMKLGEIKQRQTLQAIFCQIRLNLGSRFPLNIVCERGVGYKLEEKEKI